MKAVLPVLLVLLLAACAGVKPVAIDFHLPSVEPSTFLDSYYRQGWELLRQGDSEAAYRSFQLCEAPLDSKQAAFGYVFLARRRYVAAAEQFAAALETNPANREAAMGRAMVLEAEGKTAEAFRAYGALTLQPPDDAWARLKTESIRAAATQAHLLEAERARDADHEAYIRALEKAAFYSPDLADISLQIAEHYAARKDWARSLPRFEAALEKEPHNEAVLRRLADLYEQAGKYELAVITLDRLLALKPGDPGLEAEKERLRERFLELTLPEKFKRIFFKAEVNREELAALVGFYFDRHLELDGPPEILTDIDGSFAKEQIIRTVTAGILRARPDHTFQRFAVPNRADLALALNALLDFLKARGHPAGFTPAAATPPIADLSPLHRDYAGISFLVRAQVLPLDAQGNFNPTQPVSPAEAITALKKILNAVGR